jgi:type II secretory pathway component PulL
VEYLVRELEELHSQIKARDKASNDKLCREAGQKDAR